MPWDLKPWGCGSGVNGSCNNGWVQFEIYEDGLTDPVYFEKVYKETCEITAYICQMFGIGSNHGDVNHWFPKHDKSMATARADVAALLKAAGFDTYIVQVDGLYKVHGDLGSKLLEVVNALFAVLAILGIVTDPTTAGLKDSEQAMIYTQPKK